MWLLLLVTGGDVGSGGPFFDVVLVQRLRSPSLAFICAAEAHDGIGMGGLLLRLPCSDPANVLSWFMPCELCTLISAAAAAQGRLGVFQGLQGAVTISEWAAGLSDGRMALCRGNEEEAAALLEQSLSIVKSLYKNSDDQVLLRIHR